MKSLEFGGKFLGTKHSLSETSISIPQIVVTVHIQFSAVAWL